MIVRQWRGWAAPERRQAYVEHFTATVLPQLRGIDGFHGAELLARDEAGRVEYLVETRWDSMEAIKAFAGETPENAVVEPAAIAALLDYERVVRHFTIAAASS